MVDKKTEQRGLIPVERARVLVVEDVRHIAHFLRHNLEKVGYETRVVHHGDEVLAAVEEFKPHALLLDMILPGMSGLQICQALRADPAHADLVVIIVTGHSFDDASAQEVEAAGADWQFSKPVSPVSLRRKLAKLGIPPALAEATP